MTTIGLSDAIKKMKEHSAGRLRMTVHEAVECAYAIEEHRRWNNAQIQRIAEVIGMPHAHSEIVVNNAIAFIESKRGSVQAGGEGGVMPLLNGLLAGAESDRRRE